jgi:hypothetical protein
MVGEPGGVNARLPRHKPNPGAYAPRLANLLKNLTCSVPWS